MLLTAALLAAPPAPAISIQYAPLATAYIGDLSDTTTLSHSVELRTLYWHSKTLPLSAHMAIDVIWGTVEHTGQRFPYPAGAQLDVLTFFFRPTLCWSPDLPLRACGGIGQGTFNLGNASDARDWGTWNYELQLDVDLHPHISVFGQAKYVGQVEQEVDGVYAWFTALMAGGGLALHW